MSLLTVNTFDTMIGKIISSIIGEVNDDLMIFEATDGTKFQFIHHQDCCEHVSIVDIIGNLQDLIGKPILEAEEISSEGYEDPELTGGESHTWTFYRFSTIKGTVTVRWLGESNGYYSEGVDFEVILPK